MHPMKQTIIYLFLLCQAGLTSHFLQAQNSITGDGFGGRLWYKPTNYSQGSYAGFAVCGPDSQLYAWGDNLMGNFGSGNNSHSGIPVKITGMNHVAFVTSGYISAGIKADRSGWVWGTPYADYIKSLLYNLSPVKILDSVIHCDAGQHNTGFVKQDGTVWFYGIDKYGMFGNGVRDGAAGQKKLVQMKGVNDAVRVAVTDYASAVLTSSGTLIVAGDNAKGNLGMTYPNYATMPQSNPNLKDIVDIKGANMGFCALDKNGDVWTWGYHRYGLVGDGDTSSASTVIPKKNAWLKHIVAISGSNDGWHFMALDSQGDVYAWGWNLWGSCGYSPIGPVLEHPKLVASNVIDIMAGETFSMIVKKDMTLWMAGASGNGKIWLNLKDSIRGRFVQVDPTAPGIDLCPPQIRNTDLHISAKIKGNCQGDWFVFVGKSDAKNAVYSWTYNQNVYHTDSFALRLNHAGKDSAVFRAKDISNGNEDSMKLYFFANPKPVLHIHINDSIQCIKDNEFIFSHTGNTPVVTDFTWYCMGYSANKVNPWTQQFSSTGSFPVTLTALSDSGCRDTFLSNILILPSPTASFQADIVNTTGNAVKITNTSTPKPLQSLFDFGTYGFSTKDTILSAKVLNSFWARLIVTDTNGCKDSTSKYINFKYPVDVYFPTAFTPGKDQLNMLFLPVHTGELYNYSLRIYNRWGQKLFDATDSKEGWDGTYLNLDCQEGVYVFTSKFQDQTGKGYEFRGTFHLIRGN